MQESVTMNDDFDKVAKEVIEEITSNYELTRNQDKGLQHTITEAFMEVEREMMSHKRMQPFLDENDEDDYSVKRDWVVDIVAENFSWKWIVLRFFIVNIHNGNTNFFTLIQHLSNTPFVTIVKRLKSSDV